MRYVSPYQRLALYTNDGRRRHQFENGELIVGDPAGASGVNIIDATQSAPPLATELQVVSPAGSNDLEKVGLNTLFWAAPPLTPADALAAVEDTVYEVLQGPVTYDGVVYQRGERFKVDGTATAFTGTGAVVALAVPAPYNQLGAEQYREEAFKIKHMGRQDEIADKPVWSFEDEGGFPPQSPGLLNE